MATAKATADGDTVACASLAEEVGLHGLIGPERVAYVDSHPLSASAHPRHTSAWRHFQRLADMPPYGAVRAKNGY